MIKNDLPEILNSLKKYKELVLNDKEINGEKLFNTNVVGKSRIKESGDYNLSGNRYQSSERGLYIVGKWQEVQLKEICELKKGSSITKKDVKKGSVPVIAGGQNPAYFHNESNRAGETITVSSSGAYSGFVNYFDIPIWASDCTTIKALDNSKISTKYLYYILKFKQSDIYKLQQGMGQPHVYAKDLEKIQIPLLPIEEQKKIVEELDRYQRIIDGARMVIDNWKPEIEVGDVTNFVKLKELANVSSSKRIYQSEYVEEGIPFYRSKEIIELSKGKSITTELFISKERFEEIKSKFGCPQKGDILITAVGSIGDVYVVDLETEFYFKDGNILWLKDVEDSVNPFYLASVLETIVKKDINKLAAGAAYKAMTIEKLKEIEIPIAPMEKQLEIMKYIKENKDFVKKNKLLIKQIKKKQGSIIEQIYGR
jgi:type I restriction enzyme M protein